MSVKTTIKHRRDTAAEWARVNPVLASGEVGFEKDTFKTKIGNGTTAWAALPYQNNLPVTGDFLPTADNAYTLGNSTFRWKSLFVGGNLTFNDNTVQTSASAPIQYLNAYSDIDQAGSTAAGTPVTFNHVDPYKGISVVSSSRLTVTKAGVYNIQFSVQLENTNKNNPYDGTFWVRVNGVDQVASTGIVTCPSKAGASNGTVVAGWNYLQTLTAGQYVELVWIKENAAINLSAVAATTSPAVPASPSAAITMTMVA